MIDSAPKIVGLSVDLHEHLIQVPLPLRDLAHIAGAPHTDLTGEHRPEPVDPLPNALVADVDPAFVEKVFDVAQGQRKTNVHHHRKLDDFGRCLKVAERVLGHPVTLAGR